MVEVELQKLDFNFKVLKDKKQTSHTMKEKLRLLREGASLEPPPSAKEAVTKPADSASRSMEAAEACQGPSQPTRKLSVKEKLRLLHGVDR